MLIIEKSVAEWRQSQTRETLEKLGRTELTLLAKFLFDVIEEHLGHQALDIYHFKQWTKSNMAHAAKRRKYFMYWRSSNNKAVVYCSAWTKAACLTLYKSFLQKKNDAAYTWLKQYVHCITLK